MRIYFRPIKALIIFIIGIISFPRFRYLNSLTFKGVDVFKNLPSTNVLFVSNHQTYFADIIAMLHIMCASKWGFKKLPYFPIYLFWPEIKVKFIAAEETMKKGGLLPLIFILAGSISVKRTWRSKGENVQRKADPNDTNKINEALSEGWVITFPQGTTRSFAPGRKGTAVMIQNHSPTVVPIVINGFRRAFDRKGFFLKKRKTALSITFKEPLSFDNTSNTDDILNQVMESIEQTNSYFPSKTT